MMYELFSWLQYKIFLLALQSSSAGMVLRSEYMALGKRSRMMVNAIKCIPSLTVFVRSTLHCSC